MTFVINKKIESKDSFENEDYLFDCEQYDFLIGRKTALSSKALLNNPAKLQYVLKNFQSTDPVLLDQL